MFQKFKVLSQPETAAVRVSKLRQTFDQLDVDGVLIPKSDEYLGEYIPECAERLAWLTSFTGSAGSAFIMRDQAVIFIDGRYTSQVIKQCDPDIFSFEDSVANPPSKWIKNNIANGFRLGVNPWVLPSGSIDVLKSAIASIGGSLVMLKFDPIDQVWDDQPDWPLESVSIQPLEYAGQLAKEKLSNLRDQLKETSSDAFVIADPTSVAWLFNIRGSDVIHTPTPLSRAIIRKDGDPLLFIDKRKLDIECKAYLTQLARLCPPSEFEDELIALAKINAKVRIDPHSTSHAVSMMIADNGGEVIKTDDPVSLPRAIKNSAEISGTLYAHKVDGAAVTSFIAWLKAQTAGDLDEIKVAQKLEATRATFGEKHQLPLKDISFDTISGSGPNAAIIHYRVDEQSNRQLQDGEMILVDSGGQYVAGTTDITRTIGLGEVPTEQKRFFTLVLKGMIDISMLRFPEKTRGVDIDAFARVSLWNAGVDFAHGTGHGVGSYLSVHEGPQSLSRRSMTEFEPGMIISNEPGYYRDGAFGIRIENLITVHEAREIEGGEIPMLGFDTLTLCPIDRELVLPELLNTKQLDWLNLYHKKVCDELSPLIDDEQTLEWLKWATAPIA